MKQLKLPVWNSFDEFGLIVGLGHWTEDNKELKYVRYPGETNLQLRERILKVFKYKSNSSHQGLVNSLSRDFLTERYNVTNKYHYFLTDEPYAQASGIKVYASGSSGWEELYPQIRASGYSDATSGWIVWNEPDVIVNGTVSYGNYTQILEILENTLPDDETPLKIEYQILDSYNENGIPILNWKTDIDSFNIQIHEDFNYRVKKEIIPDPSSQIVIYSLNSLKESAFSGIFYTSEGAATSKLKEISNYFNRKHPIEWGKFSWDSMTWEQGSNLSRGVIPTLFDANLPVDQSGNLEADKFLGGVAQGPNLYLMDIIVEEDVSNSGAYAHWYPKVYPGTFYLSNTGYYLFENKQTNYTYLYPTVNTGNISSFENLPSYDDFIILGTSGYVNFSGEYFAELYRYPYGPNSGFATTQVYRRRYDLNKIGSEVTILGSGEYTINFDNGMISGNLSGIAPQIQMIWEHPDASGIGKIISGLDLNPYNYDRKTSILFLG